MAAFILWLIAIGFSIPLTIFRGYVIYCMWNWFVLTQFTAAPHISIVGAIGLSYLAIMLQHIHEDKDDTKRDTEEVAIHLFGSLIKGGIITLMMWGCAYIVHCYM